MALDANMTQHLLEEWNFPKKALYNRVIAKDMLIKSGHLNPVQKKLVAECVRQINWVFVITQSNSNILNFESDSLNVREIDYISAELKDGDLVSKVADALLNAIPKMVLLELSWIEEGTCYHTWVVADYKLQRGKNNLLNASRVLVSSRVTQDKMEGLNSYLDFNIQSNRNLLDLYKSFANNLQRYEFETKTGNILSTQINAEEINIELDELRKRLNRLMLAAKTESQLNKRMKIIAEVTQVKNRIKELEAGSF